MTLTNAQMLPNRFAKLARGRRLLRKMNATWDVGGYVRVDTATRYTDFRPKHRDLILLGASGSLYMKRGRATDCIDFCSFQFAV